jgi:hypothetical protein
VSSYKHSRGNEQPRSRDGRLTEKLPTTATGKVWRVELRAHAIGVLLDPREEVTSS